MDKAQISLRFYKMVFQIGLVNRATRKSIDPQIEALLLLFSPRVNRTWLHFERRAEIAHQECFVTYDFGAKLRPWRSLEQTLAGRPRCLQRSAAVAAARSLQPCSADSSCA